MGKICWPPRWKGCIAAAFCLALVACWRPAPQAVPLAVRSTPTLIPVSTPVLLETQASSIFPTPTPSLPDLPGSPSTHPPISSSQTPLPVLPRSLYTFTIKYDYIDHRLEVKQSLRLSNPSGDEWHDLLLRVPPNRRPGIFSLLALSRESGVSVDPYKLEGEMLWLSMNPPLQPGQQTTLYIDYDLQIPNWFGYFGRSSRQTNLGDWYPYLPPYLGQDGWLIPEPAQVGEYLAYDTADYQVDILLENNQLPIQIAASAAAQTLQGRYSYTLEGARSFAWSASHEYQLLTTAAGQVVIQAYVFPEHVQPGQAALETASQAIELFSRFFGPYPHSQLTLVEGTFFDGMEYDGLFFLGHEYFESFPGSARSYLTALTAHEIAHQWWYGKVGNDPAHEPWLDEALATYSELLFYEAYHPELVDWWWNFRVQRFEPQGWLDSTIYDLPDFRSYVNAVYLRGALFLASLRVELGDEAFFAFLRDYANRNSGNLATSQSFFEILGEHSKEDLNELRDRYFKESLQP
jgi:hypothetical protein